MGLKMSTNGKASRTVAVLNLFAGMAIMLILLLSAGLGGEGYFASAMGLFLVGMGLVWYRIHRVFEDID